MTLLSTVFGRVGNIYLPGHFNGLGVSHAADTEHDITVAVGSAVDATGALYMALASAITKRFDAEFSAGDGNGGMAAGESLPASGTIHLWAIGKAGVATDVMANNFATSALAPSLPAGYDYKRRIWSYRTDASNNIINGKQWGTGRRRRWEYKSPILDVNQNNTGTNAVTAPISTPGGLEVLALLTAYLSQAATAAHHVSALAANDLSPSLTASPLFGGGSGVNAGIDKEVLTDTASRIRYRCDVSNAGNYMRIATRGWEDSL